MRRFYTVLLYVLTPFILLRLLWRGLRAPGYRQRWRERFAAFDVPDLAAAIWVHAVSVGEVNAAVPLVKALRQQHPDSSIAITTVTPTGSEQVRHVFGDSVFHVYAPYDLPGTVARFLDAVQPRIAVIMETEIWPNLYHACRARGIPLVIANGRVSERSVGAYRLADKLFAPALRCVSAVAAQSRGDAKRLTELGVPAERVQVSGSVKFDISLSEQLVHEGEAMREAWGPERPVWIAASTHEGEDDIVLNAFDRLRMRRPQTLLILVPRHPERFERVAAMLMRRDYLVSRRSRHDLPCADTQVFLVDTMGELPLFYVPADVAFVGGSLVPVGGHNVLEASALGKPVIVGPHYFNFREIMEALFAARAALRVQGAHDLGDVLIDLFDKAQWRREIGHAGRQVVLDNRGALHRMLDVIEKQLTSR